MQCVAHPHLRACTHAQKRSTAKRRGAHLTCTSPNLHKHKRQGTCRASRRSSRQRRPRTRPAGPVVLPSPNPTPPHPTTNHHHVRSEPSFSATSLSPPYQLSLWASPPRLPLFSSEIRARVSLFTFRFLSCFFLSISFLSSLLTFPSKKSKNSREEKGVSLKFPPRPLSVQLRLMVTPAR